MALYWVIRVQKTILCMVGHTYNPSTQDTEAGGVQVQGQRGLYTETLPQKIKNEKK
jgi:hypothetical protein